MAMLVSAKLVFECLIVYQGGIILVEETLHSCVDCDFRELTCKYSDNHKHDNEGFIVVVANGMSQTFKPGLYTVSDPRQNGVL